MRIVFLFLFAAASACSQPFSAGLKIGVPLTDFVSTVEGVSSTIPNRYVIGAMGELRLPFSLGVEVDALYRRVNYRSTVGSVLAGFTSDRTTANSWEFPIVGKYRFHGRIARPYVEAGIAFDTLTGLTDAVTQTIASGISTRATSTTTSTPAALRDTATKGFVIGGGLDVHAILIHVSPEIRFTRWGTSQFNLNGVLSSNQNQAEFLLGITF